MNIHSIYFLLYCLSLPAFLAFSFLAKNRLEAKHKRELDSIYSTMNQARSNMDKVHDARHFTEKKLLVKIQELRASQQLVMSYAKIIDDQAACIDRLKKRDDERRAILVERFDRIRELETEREKVASGKVTCADCNALLAKW